MFSVPYLNTEFAEIGAFGKLIDVAPRKAGKDGLYTMPPLPAGKATRQCFLMGLENIDRESWRVEKRRVRRGAEIDGHRHQRRVERNRRKRVRGHSAGNAGLVERGDHGDAGGESAAELPEFEGIHLNEHPGEKRRVQHPPW